MDFKQFHLKSGGKVFNVVKFYEAATVIPAVHGISEDGKYETFARIEDVDAVEGEAKMIYEAHKD